MCTIGFCKITYYRDIIRISHFDVRTKIIFRRRMLYYIGKGKISVSRSGYDGQCIYRLNRAPMVVTIETVKITSCVCFRPGTTTTAVVSWKGLTGSGPTASRPGRRTTSSAPRRTAASSWPRAAVGPAPIRCASTRGPGTRYRPNGFTSSTSSTSAFPVRRRRSYGPRPSAPAATSTRAKKVRCPSSNVCLYPPPTLARDPASYTYVVPTRRGTVCCTQPHPLCTANTVSARK